MRYCLDFAELDAASIDYVVFYDKPFIKFERLLETYLAMVPRGFSSFRVALPLWLKEKLFLRRLLAEELRNIDGRSDWGPRMLFTEHHQSHAASAFFPSRFEEAVVLTMDGVGEWATTSAGIGRGSELSLFKEIHFPHSLGLLYSAFTYYTGFKVNSGEYKLMGLAPYGEARFKKIILDNLIDVKPDGSFRLNLDYFDYCTGLRMTNESFDRLFGAPARNSKDLLTQFHMDIAASIQEVLELVVFQLAEGLSRETGQKNLCLAGGVALNCVANGKLLRRGVFDDIWIQPASGDAGGSVGAALAAYHQFAGRPRERSGDMDQMSGAFLGPEYEPADVKRRLSGVGARFEVVAGEKLTRDVASALADGAAVGWFQGRMEFGPRALGNRSILGDARSPTMQKMLNLKIKYRESFRPFAPSVLAEHVSDWFDLDRESPYMLLVADVAGKHRRAMSNAENALFGIEKLNVARSSIPAVTHIDYSARVQTVHRETNPRYHDLISEFYRLTGCPVIVNTSFNVRGEPIVCTPEDAFRCFMGCELDLLVVGECVMRKKDQDPALKLDYTSAFEAD
jgi:carbamoyltransferase